MGKCEYILAKDSSNNTLEITHDTEACGSGLVSCTRSVTVNIADYIVQLKRGMVLVNGEEVALPAYLNGRVFITLMLYILSAGHSSTSVLIAK